LQLEFSKKYNDVCAMNFELRAKMIKTLPIQTGKGKNGDWQKQDFVVETYESYPKKVCLTIWNERLSQINGVEEGDELRVSFGVSSREYNEKWYSDLTAFSVENISQKQHQNGLDQAQTSQNKTKINSDEYSPDLLAAEQDDDLPF
jgi:hypothetical protein